MNSDALQRHAATSPRNDDSVDTISVDVVSEIEKELMESPYDITSLVFLLYDVPDTALQRLIVYQRISKDKYSTNMSLLQEWTQVSKLKPTWRYEFLEALLVCQLYGIVKKLGFNVQSLIKIYQPDNIYFNMYLNPTKKALYKLCENINSENLDNLKKTLHTYKIDTVEYESCELVFLKLMSEKVIALNEFNYDMKPQFEFNFDKLIKLIHKMPGLETFAEELRMVQNRQNGGSKTPLAASSPRLDPLSDVTNTQTKQDQELGDVFRDTFELLKDLKIDDDQMQSDSKKLAKYNYAIKDPNKIGLCLIINQEDFHLCDQSIEDESLRISLTKRKGSTLDKMALEKTMSDLNFEVISRDNLDHRDMINFIKRCIIEKVRSTDSIFMLCIMSHGVRDHVFAADSVKVKVEDIQNLLDSEIALKLRGIPKVLIIQACQVDDIPQPRLVADSPNPFLFLQKSDFLVFWATSPEYEAYRSEEAGSIFIQLICMYFKKNAKVEHLFDIFTKVNNGVTSYCSRFGCSQVPIFKSTLRKKLYLHFPPN